MEWFGSVRKAACLTGLNEVDSDTHKDSVTRPLSDYLLSNVFHGNCVEQLSRQLSGSNRARLTEHHLKVLVTKVTPIPSISVFSHQFY